MGATRATWASAKVLAPRPFSPLHAAEGEGAVMAKSWSFRPDVGGTPLACSPSVSSFPVWALISEMGHNSPCLLQVRAENDTV